MAKDSSLTLGVETCERGAHGRTFWRSTRAHNAVVVDGAEQFEIWAAFRVGDRTQLLECAFQQQSSASLFVGAHSGFVGQKTPTTHRRFIASLAGGFWLVLDEINGNGNHAIERLVHLVAQRFLRGYWLKPTLMSEWDHLQLRFYPSYRDKAGSPKQRRAVLADSWIPFRGGMLPNLGRGCQILYSIFHRVPHCLQGSVTSIAPADREVSSWTVEVNDLDRLTQVHISVFSPQGNVVEHFSVPHRNIQFILRGHLHRTNRLLRCLTI